MVCLKIGYNLDIHRSLPFWGISQLQAYSGLRIYQSPQVR